MPLLPRFDTPASLRDVPLTSSFYNDWSHYIEGLISDVTLGDNGGAFYDPTATDVRVAGMKTMVWMGFPRDLIHRTNRDNREAAYRIADMNVSTRVNQNEYFEWRVDRNAAGKITRVTFVTEFRKYYELLWNVDRAAVVTLYRTLVSPAVAESDLHIGGSYNHFNRWNTTDGIVHYIQGINTLSAAVGLSEGSVRAVPPFRDNFEARPRAAGAFTSVDPRISYDVHMLVRKGLYVSLEDPVGFYMVDWDNSGITEPGGAPAPSSYWKIVRGRPGQVLRLVYEVPAAKPFVVGDLSIGGVTIQYGGQLAEQISVGITGVAGSLVKEGMEQRPTT